MQVMCQRRENIVEATLRDPFGHIYSRPHAHRNEAGATLHTKHKDEAKAAGEGDGPGPQPQPDFFHSILPHIKQWIICDIMALSLMVILVVKFTLLSSVRAVIVLKRFFLIQGLLFFLRGSSIYLTSQQLPLTSCVSTISEDSSAAVEAIYIMLGLHRTCADLLFSGHGAFFTLGFLLVWTYDKGEQWTRLCGWGDILKRERAQLAEERRRAQEELASQNFAASPALAAITAPSSSSGEGGGFFQSGSEKAPAAASATVESGKKQKKKQKKQRQQQPQERHAIVVSVVPFRSPPPKPLRGAAASSIPLQSDDQLRLEAHETLNRLHPWFIPELNSAGDPSTLTVSSLFLLFYLVFGCFMLVSTHFHYSIDVLIGVLISWFTFHAYHSTLKTLHERRRGPIKRFITWIEHIPKVGEFVSEEDEDEQRHQAFMQREHFEAAPAVSVPVAVALPTTGTAGAGDKAKAGAAAASTSVPSTPLSLPVPLAATASSLHTYVYFSLTHNRYVLKRVREAEDIQFATRQEKQRAEEEEEEEEEGGSFDEADLERQPLDPKRNSASYSGMSAPTRSRSRSSGAGAASSSASAVTSERKEGGERPLSRAEEDERLAQEDAADRYREHGIDVEQQSPY